MNPLETIKKFVAETDPKWSEDHWPIKLSPTLVSGGSLVSTMSPNGAKRLKLLNAEYKAVEYTRINDVSSLFRRLYRQ